MREDIRLYIHNCEPCNKAKRPKPKPHAALNSYLAGHPMDRVAMDIIGPLPKTQQGNKYILVIGDHFTRWMDAYAIGDQTSHTIAGKLVKEFMCRFGIPLDIHTDQGKHFDSQLVHDICKLLQVKKTRSTAYHPESNGLIEKFNQTLGQLIRTHVLENQDWDEDIDLLMAAYRSTKHPATGYSPNYMMLGREVYSPLELQFPIRNNHISHLTDQHRYAVELQERLSKCYLEARTKLKETAERQKRDYDTRTMKNAYDVESLVYKFNNVHHKFETPWSGPYIVLKKFSPAVYKIRNKHKSEVIHHDRLKPYTSREIPGWALKIRKSIIK